MFDRRDFLSSLAAVATAPALWHTSADDPLAGIPANLLNHSLYETNEGA